MNIKDLKSCANCGMNGIAISHGGFTVMNDGCDDCKNYNNWDFDGLTSEQRFKQEKGE